MNLAFLSWVAFALLGLPAARAAGAEGATSARLHDALEAALTVSASRIEVVGVDGHGADCGGTAAAAARFEIPNPIEGSGRVSVKVRGVRANGAACEAWLWARVRVMGQVAVARRAIRSGEPLAPAIELEEREIHPGHGPATICADCVADRFIGAGQIVESGAVRSAGLRNGAPVKVVLASGALTVEQMGHAVACGKGQCAVLPSGKHVEGALVDGRLVVALP